MSKYLIKIENTPAPDKTDETKVVKEVVVNAPSLCEACVMAKRAHTGFSVVSWRLEPLSDEEAAKYEQSRDY